MNELIPPFDWLEHVVIPWREDAAMSIWVVVMGFFVTASCGLVGVYLLLRRMALVGDAISHSILPGLVVAFLVFKETGTGVMLLGAIGAGMVTVVLIEFIHRQSRVKPDAAICIAFTLLFAIGVAMLSGLETQGSFHLDADCVLYGEIAFVALEPPLMWGETEIGPPSVIRMGAVLVGVLVMICLFFKELLITSFDPALAKSLGMRSAVWHYGLMAMLSIVVVSAFESVGAILAVAMLIVPPMFAAQLSDRMIPRMGLVILHAAASALLGYHLSLWLVCSPAGAMAVAASFLFVIAWLVTSALKVLGRRRSVASYSTSGLEQAEASD